MVYSIDEIRRAVAPVAEKYSIPVVYLFGSYARGEASTDSDVDLLIECRGSSIKGLFDLGAVYNDFNIKLGKNIDLLTTDSVDQPEAKRRAPWIADNIERDKVVLYESSHINP
ncbi:MAG: nucleotidyltransferase family protein [Eubacteriales bacterium]